MDFDLQQAWAFFKDVPTSVYAVLIASLPTILFLIDPASRLLLLIAKPFHWVTRRLVYKSFFIAVPMSSVSREEYDVIRSAVADISKSLKRRKLIFPLIIRVNSLASKYKSYDEFNSARLSLEKSIKGVKRAGKFVLIYPNNPKDGHAPSSTLIETGIAFALEKPTVVFVRDGVNLPYMLREAPNVDIKRLRVKTYEYEKIEDIADRVRREGPDSLFIDEQHLRSAA